MKVKLLTTDIQVRHQLDNAVKALAQCYQSENMTFKKLINIAMVRGHKTILEYFELVFDIEKINYASHVHLVRQRLTVPMIQSQRYTSTFEIVIPDAIKNSEVATKAYTETAKKAFDTYNYLITKHNVKKEDARCILPQGVLINMCYKMNLREFMYIVDLRTSKETWSETRNVVNAMLTEVKKNDILGRFF